MPSKARLARHAFAAFAAASTVAAFALPAQAAPSNVLDDTHPWRHGIVPTVDGAKNSLLGLPINIPLLDQNLTYGGGNNGVGVTTGAPKVYLVFWGSQWGTAGTNAKGDTTLTNDPAGAAPVVQEFFKGLGTNGEGWSKVMTQYCEGVASGTETCPASAAHVGYPTGGALAGV